MDSIEAKKIIKTTDEVTILETKNTLEFIIPYNPNLVDKIKEIVFKHDAIHIKTYKKQVGFRNPIEKKEEATVNFN
jgi:hypothetical protein